jgi:molecular chaperone DnaK (HSP70)
MRLLAIDFGTSNTVAVVGTPDGRFRPLLFDGALLLPSAVYLATDGRVLVGPDAQRAARGDPTRFEPNPKRRVDDGTVLLGAVPLPVARLVAAVYAQVLTEARRALGAPPDQVRLSHPAGWGAPRREMLVEAARLAGLGPVRLVPEPVAAAGYYTAMLGATLPPGRCLAVYDLGGGTFDAAVVRTSPLSPSGFEVLASAGLPDVGGIDFDHALARYLHAPAAAVPEVRGAKESLSRLARTDVHLPSGPAHLTRGELEQVLRPYLTETVRCLAGVVRRAGVAPGELAGVFLVGGSSRIPLAAALIHTELGVPPVVLEEPQTAVAEGLLRLPGLAPSRRPARFVAAVTASLALGTGRDRLRVATVAALVLVLAAFAALVWVAR